MLGDAHAAEDAYQATFIVLLRKAHSLTSCATLAEWLHSVARRIALKARVAEKDEISIVPAVAGG